MGLFPPCLVLRVAQSVASMRLDKEPRELSHLRTQVLGPIKGHVSSQLQALESRTGKVLLTGDRSSCIRLHPPHQSFSLLRLF